jgi:TfoX/Sxy family transcriptional regulator of competence genes
MAYDDKLASRVRKALEKQRGVTEKKMFGGLCFMLGDAMCCGIVGGELMARVGADRYAEALARPGARPMDFSGKPMVGYVFVGEAGMRTASDLARWVEWCASFVKTLPPKSARRRKR